MKPVWNSLWRGDLVVCDGAVRVRWHSLGRSLLPCSLALLLSACASVPSDPPSAREPAARPSPPVRAVPSPQQRLTRLLAEAEQATREDRLMRPSGDNAYDRYRAALLLDPGNAQAVSGLQQLVIRYWQLGREALGRGRLSEAETYLARARHIQPGSPLLTEFSRALAQARASQPPPVAAAADENVYPLETQVLNDRGEEIQSLLREVARRLQDSGETVLIVARSDEEGRWLYQQLRNAAGGHRIRGDIKTGAQPKLVVYPPIQ